MMLEWIQNKWHRRRLIRWLPWPTITRFVGAMFYWLVGMCFIAGLDFLFGIEGRELTEIDFPNADWFGWFLVAVAIRISQPLAISRWLYRGAERPVWRVVKVIAKRIWRRRKNV